MMVLPFVAALVLNGQSVSRLGFGLVVASASSCSVAFHAAQAVWCAPIQEEAERVFTARGSSKQQGKGGSKESSKDGKEAALQRKNRLDDAALTAVDNAAREIGVEKWEKMGVAEKHQIAIDIAVREEMLAGVCQGKSFYCLRGVISNDVLPGEKGMKNAAVACGTGAMWYQHQLQEHLKHVLPRGGAGAIGLNGGVGASEARVGDVLTAQDCTFVLLFSLLAFGVNWHVCQAGVEIEEREQSRWEQYGPVAWRLRRSDAAAAALRVITPSMVVIAALEPVVLEPLSRLMGLWPAVAPVQPAAP